MTKRIEDIELNYYENVICVLEDKNTDMAIVLLNNNQIYEGNYWDYHTDCHGFDNIKKFNSLDEFVNNVSDYIKEKYNKFCIIEKRSFDYETYYV